MFNQKLIFLFIIIMFLSLSAVSASEANFTQLNDNINNLDDNSILNLTTDYKHDSVNVTVNKSITINGNDHKIINNASESFSVYADNVCIKNTTFIGGNIKWSGNNALLIDCKFINCSSANGGAIAFSGSNISVINSNFINNSADSWGGAILVNGNNNSVINIVNSSFINNLANGSGGAIFIWNGLNATIINSTFHDNRFRYFINSFQSNDLYLNVNTQAVDCVFDSPFNIVRTASFKYIKHYSNAYNDSFDELANKIKNAGDILILDKDYKFYGGNTSGILIDKTITIDGRGHTLNGSGLSRIFNILSDNVVLKNINFINAVFIPDYYNYDWLSDACGGAIYWNGKNAKIINCSFVNNTANGLKYNYNSVIVKKYLGPFSVLYSPFPMVCGWIGSDSGGAIYLVGNNAYIENCRFEGNSIGNGYAGAVYLKSNNSLITNSKFFNNYASNSKMLCVYGSNNVVDSSFFYQNRFYLGGAISPQYLSLPVSGAEVTDSYLFSSNNFSYMGFSSIEDDWIYNKLNVSKFAYWYKYYSYPRDVLDILEVHNNISLLIDGVITDSLTLDEAVSYLASLNKTYKIISGDLTIYYKGSQKFTVIVKDSNNRPQSNVYVKFTIAKHVYNVKTDENGVALLKLTQKPGKYTIKCEFGEVKVKNTVTVKSRIITKDLIKKAKKSAKFKIKILNTNGKAFAKQKVNVKFNGKTYKLKSNTKGIAVLKISNKVKKGKYTIKTTYNDLTTINKLKVI